LAHSGRTSPCQLSALRGNFQQPAQVHRRHGHGEYQLGAFEAAQIQLPKRAALVTVAEDGFDQLANDLLIRPRNSRVVI
jgi:hypothetical protein